MALLYISFFDVNLLINTSYFDNMILTCLSASQAVGPRLYIY